MSKTADGTHETKIDHSSRSTTPRNERFLEYIGSHWAEREDPRPAELPVAPFAAHRRHQISQAFPGERLVIEAGPLKQRSNDTFFPYRAHSAFAHLTGWGSASEPGAILVLDPTE